MCSFLLYLRVVLSIHISAGPLAELCLYGRNQVKGNLAKTAQTLHYLQKTSGSHIYLHRTHSPLENHTLMNEMRWGGLTEGQRAHTSPLQVCTCIRLSAYLPPPPHTHTQKERMESEREGGGRGRGRGRESESERERERERERAS